MRIVQFHHRLFISESILHEYSVNSHLFNQEAYRKWRLIPFLITVSRDGEQHLHNKKLRSPSRLPGAYLEIIGGGLCLTVEVLDDESSCLSVNAHIHIAFHSHYI